MSKLFYFSSYKLLLVRSRIAFNFAGSGPVGPVAAADEVEPPTCESAEEAEEETLPPSSPPLVLVLALFSAGRPFS